ncbi:MAG: NAD(P)/FAD-dependent oxidoreductase [Vicinamibacterales bacterium]
MTDAIVIGSGPNGLAAAITLARAGRSVRVYEAQPTAGGGLRSAALTGPGTVHDLCAAVFALVLASPFLRELPLADHGLTLVHPDVPFAHPLDDGTAAVVARSVDETAAGLGADGDAYRRLIGPWVDRADPLMEALLSPPGRRHPFLMAGFGPLAIRSAAGLARARFRTPAARALFAGAAAHGLVPLEFAATAGYGLALVLAAHAVGWPVARGGSQAVADAMVSYLRSLGGEVVTGAPVASLGDLPPARLVLCDVTPRQLIRLAGDRMPASYRRRLERFRRGPGVFKMDWRIRGPVPWAADGCRRAGTVHLGGTLDEIARGERAAWTGTVPDAPYVLVVQPGVCDPTRAPEGEQTLWAYCHVPHGSTTDMTGTIERQIERFAPGFRDRILGRHAMSPADLERRNANLAGGDIAGGAADFAQIVARPVLALDPYRTPMDGVYLCSSSTPPGVGVHGMCGHLAARSALRHG